MRVEEEKTNLGEQVVGYMLITGGVLLALLSGACSATVLIAAIRSAVRGEARLLANTLGVVAIFGGIPLVMGCTMVASGTALVRRRRAAKPNVKTF